MIDTGTTGEDGATRRCLKREGAHGVWRETRADGTECIVKHWPLTVGSACKLALGLAQVQRQMRGQRRLARAGVRSPAPRGRWRIVRDGGLLIELVLDYAPGRTALEVLREADDATEKGDDGLARTLGALVAQLAVGGVFNRDLKLSNIIVAADGALSVIDPVGVRRMRNRVADTERMLERLAIEPIDLGVPIPAGHVPRVLRPVLEPVSRADRRAILQRLRQRRRR